MLIQQEDGRYMPLYQNEQGEQAKIDLNIIDQWVINIHCNFDDQWYVGMLTEQEIIQNQQFMTIEEVFDELIFDLSNPEHINKENESITLEKMNQNMVLNKKLQVRMGKYINITEIFKWNLVRQQDEQQKLEQIKKQNEPLVEYIKQEKNKKLQIENNQILQEQFSVIQQLKEQIPQIQNTFIDQQKECNNQILSQLQELKQNTQEPKAQQSSEFNQQSKQLQQVTSQFQDLQKEIQQLKNDFLKHKISAETNQTQIVQHLKSLQDLLLQKPILNPPQQQNKVKPSDLIQSSGYFWFSPICMTCVTTLEFTLKVISQMGLVIGIDHTNIPVNDQPQYGVYLSHQMLVTGQAQTQTKFEYIPKVDDQILFKVDMNKRQVVLQANQKEIICFELIDIGESQFYICVGYFNQQEDIKEYIE